MPPEPEIRRSPAGERPATDLVDAMVAEMAPLYGRIDVPGAPTATPEQMTPPDGSFFVIYEDGRPVAGGGLKRLDASACEIKRMYVVPGARGRGLASVLLVALEEEARQLGYTVARLDTGAQQPHAQRLYERAGYRAIENFNASGVST